MPHVMEMVVVCLMSHGYAIKSFAIKVVTSYGCDYQLRMVLIEYKIITYWPYFRL